MTVQETNNTTTNSSSTAGRSGLVLALLVVAAVVAVAGWIAPLPLGAPDGEGVVQESRERGRASAAAGGSSTDEPGPWIEQIEPGSRSNWGETAEIVMTVARVPEVVEVAVEDTPDPVDVIEVVQQEETEQPVQDMPWSYVGYVRVSGGDPKAIVAIEGKQRVLSVGDEVRDSRWPPEQHSVVTSIDANEVLFESSDGVPQRASRQVREANTLNVTQEPTS